MRPLLPFAVVVCLLAPAVGVACLWDYDTLKMERARFPNTLELITGKFLRHSPEFYRWRIADRLKRLESDPNNVVLLDDLAVAYDKTGEHDKAIATAERTEKVKPGRYETAANLGTFLFHAGRLKDGLPHIDRALAVNPDAHFGREKYQKRLVEYVLKRREERGNRLPLADLESHSLELDDDPSLKGEDITVHNTFRDFLLDAYPHVPPDFLLELDTRDPRYFEWEEKKNADRRAEVAGALKGVLGMMKFGNHKSPILLEALGTLLDDGGRDDAKLLACRAFLKASNEVPDGPARIAYRSMAKTALAYQSAGPHTDRQITLDEVEAEFKTELADAERWYETVREKELAAIRDGRNPEAEFDKLYEPEPPVKGETPRLDKGAMRVVGLILVVAGTALAFGWLAVARVRRLRTTTGRQSNP